MKSFLSPKERLVSKMRRRVRVQRSFDVEPLGDGRERHTCRECKTSAVLRVLPEGTDARFAARLGAYRANGGVTGICKTCSRRRAAELYP